MGTTTKIEWCDHSASPWHGCQHAVDPDGAGHPACTNCYAEAMARRNPGTLGKWGPDGTRIVSKSFAANCRRWNKQAEAAGVRQSVFPSICDPFEAWDGQILNSDGETVYRLGHWQYSGLKPGQFFLDSREPARMDDLRRDLFATIDGCPWLDFLLLTKRPENVRRMWLTKPMPGFEEHSGGVAILDMEDFDRCEVYRSNVFLGTSISDQHTADVWVPRLLECRDLCPVLFLSVEPLLGPVDLHAIGKNASGWPAINSLTGERRAEQGPTTRVHDGPHIDWVIVGGESGPHARPMHPAWVRSIENQCAAAGVPFLFKQWGEYKPLDEPMGRICGPGVPCGLKGVAVDVDGEHHDWGDHGIGDLSNDAWMMARVGKQAAGRLLDGREWNEFPVQGGVASVHGVE